MSTNMAKIYNSYNFIPREMVILLNGCFSTLPACEIFHYFYSKTSFKMPENVVYYQIIIEFDSLMRQTVKSGFWEERLWMG